MWSYKAEGDLLWLFAGDHVINFRQVRRFQLVRNDNLTVVYIDGSYESFIGKDAHVLWQALMKATNKTDS